MKYPAIVQKVLAVTTSISMLFQSVLPFVVLPTQVFAQETAPVESPTPTVTETPTETPTPTETITVSPTPTDQVSVSPTPETSLSPTPSATVTPTIVPDQTATPSPTETGTPTPEQPTPQQNGQSTNEPPHETSPPQQGQILDGVSVTPTPTVTPEQQPETGSIEASVLDNVKAATLDLDMVDPSSATLTTDKADYAPTDTALISGTGFRTNHSYKLTISSTDAPETSTTVDITTDSEGSFVYAYQLDGNYRPNYKAVITTMGGHTVATVIFTDSASANLDQYGNDAPAGWQNGNLNSNQATYYEGDSIPYRLRFSGLTLASHTVTIEWDTTKSGKHAIDYLTTYNRSAAPNPCDGVSNCNTTTTFAIPSDPQVTGGGVTPIAGNFTMYGATITNVGSYSYPLGSGFSGDKSARLTITFTATKSNPVLAWGGHIADRHDWGNDNSAVAIPGSPYHTRLKDVDGSGGNQDRSLSTDAVIYPASITIVKDATPNGSTAFSFSATPSPLSNFTLTDDGTTANTKQFSSITNFQTYTVTENTLSGWSLSNIQCSVTSANGGTQTSNVGQRKATINLEEGENVTCTFSNTQQTGTLIVKKVVINDNGGTKTASDFSFQVNNGTAVAFNANGQNTMSVGIGTYTVTEPAAAGYTTTYDNCSNISITNGGTQTCTITNNDQPSKLIVKKIVSNTHGGTKVASDFGFQINGGSVTPFEADGQNDLTVTPGTYTVTEPAAAGYTTTYDNCSSVAVTLGGTQTCTITNSDQAATLIIRKVVINDNGGTKSAHDFTFQVNGGTATAFEADGENSITVAAGTYTVTEPSFDGYTTTYDNCSTIHLANGGSATCTITNNDQPATLTVKKIVINDNGGTSVAKDFSFQVNWGTAIPFEEDGENVMTVNAGTYSVTEPSVDGYTTTYDSCSRVVIPNGGSATCTITNNDQPATLIVKKIVDNVFPGTYYPSDFSFSVNGGSLTQFENDGQNSMTVPAGTYTVTEPAYDGFDTTYDHCASLVIPNGGTATCTITNTGVDPILRLQKNVINNNGGTKTPHDWLLTADGDDGFTDPGDSTAFHTVDPGDYQLSESNVPGYTSLGWSCDGGVLKDATLTLKLGEVVTCTITNDDQASTLIVKKHVINDNGGTKDAADFTMHVQGNAVSQTEFPGEELGTTLSIQPGEFSVTEDELPGYHATYGRECSGTIALGETKTCTITNDDVSAKLTLIKTVINDNGGTKAVSDFALSVGDTTVKSGEANTFTAGDYTVSEKNLFGYTPSGWGGDCDATGHVTLAVGDNKTCTIVNDDVAPQLTIIKHVINDNGGTMNASDFTMHVQGTDVSSDTFPGNESGTTVTLKEGTYGVSEDAISGYKETDSSDCAGTIHVGEVKTCTITNDDTFSSVTVTKFEDKNGNGWQDEGEETLQGFEMNLASESGALHQTTGENGTTTFGPILSDTYQLSETEKAGYRFTGMYCQESESSSQTNGMRIRLGTEDTMHCFVGNIKQDPILTISKKNDAEGDKAPGENVTFTITVEATQSAAYNVQVTDLLPLGFTYRTNSWTAQSDTRGDLKAQGITTQPTYHSPGVWQLGDMAENETVTLTYIADISNDQKPGTYKDLAWAFGCKSDTACAVNDGNDVLSRAVNPGFVDESFVGTQVSIVKSTQSGATLNKSEGEVLGASTELPATGAQTIWLVIAILFLLTGVGCVTIGYRLRRLHA